MNVTGVLNTNLYHLPLQEFNIGQTTLKIHINRKGTGPAAPCCIGEYLNNAGQGFKEY